MEVNYHVVLRVRIEGPAVEAGTIALRDLALFGQELQSAFEGVARLSAGEKVARRGALPEFLRAATAVEITAVERGSFSLTLSLPQSQYADLGGQALASLIDGLVEFREQKRRLPRRYDNRVLKAWHNIGRLFNDGIDKITFDLRTNQHQTQAEYDRELYSLINKRIARIVGEAGVFEGYLQMADFTRLRCRLHLPSGETVPCEFSAHLMDKVDGALRKYARVEGTVYRETTTGKVRRFLIRNISMFDKAELEYPLAEDIDEQLWLKATAHNPVFDYLHDPEEDIYSLDDGKPFHD